MAEIAIRNVVKFYGKDEIIPGIDLTIHNGEFVVILGPSGCGKSTLLRMIAGLEVITSGDIAIGDVVVNKLEPRERGCAMVFQNYALYPHMSVADNIGYALKIAGVKKAERMEKIREVATIIGLTDFLDRKPGQLSGGQRQRVAMGRAIIREPEVFLFDEPLSNLDAKLRVQMRLEIRKLHDRLAATSVFVTHDQVEAMTLADRLVVMNQGHIEQFGTPEEIYDTPASTYVANFIGSPPMNLVPGKVTPDGNSLILNDTIKIPFLPGQLAEYADRAVTIGVRPEQVHWADGEANTTALLEHEFTEELGAAKLYYGKLFDNEFIVHSAQKQKPTRGDQQPINIPSSAIHLFDSESGQRLSIDASLPANQLETA